MNRLILDNTVTGGFPFDLDDLEFDQIAVRDAFKAIANIYGILNADGCQLFGCERTSGGGSTINVAAGAVMLAGEIYNVNAHSYTSASPGEVTYWSVTSAFDPAGNEVFQDASSKDTYELRTASLVTTTTGAAPADRLEVGDSYSFYEKMRRIINEDYHNIGDPGEPAFSNGWVDGSASTYNVPRFRLGADNKVHLSGRIDGSSSTSNTMFTLATSYRPANRIEGYLPDSGGTFAQYILNLLLILFNMEIIKEALKHIGVQEIVGEKHNPTIVDWFAEVGHSWNKNDELAWCSVFANVVAKRTGHRHTKKLNARSWSTDAWLGKEVELSEALPGDVVVFSRTSNPAYGHVAFFINEDEDGKNINVLGGNQSNMVNISPYNKSRLVKIIRLYKDVEESKSNLGSHNGPVR
jgi:uncharacterized protein (TIGR02594 family)